MRTPLQTILAPKNTIVIEVQTSRISTLLQHATLRRWRTLAFNKSIRTAFGRNYAMRPNYYQGLPQRQSSPSILNRIKRIQPNVLVYTIIGINVAVFATWSYAIESAKRFRDFKLYKLMTDNFLLSKMNILAGRIYVLITSCFSHMSSSHILVNSVSLWGLGLPLAYAIGSLNFLSLYFASGIVSGLVFLTTNQFLGSYANRIYANGASGAIYGVMAFFACMNPSATFLLFFIIPVQARLLVPGIILWDLYHVFNRGGSNIASDAHVGGALTGIAFWVFRRRLLLP